MNPNSAPNVARPSRTWEIVQNVMIPALPVRNIQVTVGVMRNVPNVGMERQGESAMTTTDPLLRANLSIKIQDFLDNPDFLWEELTEPGENLLTYLEETGAPIPELPEDPERRRDVVKLMYRYWMSREALHMAKELLGSNKIWGDDELEI